MFKKFYSVFQLFSLWVLTFWSFPFDQEINWRKVGRGRKKQCRVLGLLLQASLIWDLVLHTSNSCLPVQWLPNALLASLVLSNDSSVWLLTLSQGQELGNSLRRKEARRIWAYLSEILFSPGLWFLKSWLPHQLEVKVSWTNIWWT